MEKKKELSNVEKRHLNVAYNNLFQLQQSFDACDLNLQFPLDLPVVGKTVSSHIRLAIAALLTIYDEYNF